jgi:hypothetical protein
MKSMDQDGAQTQRSRGNQIGEGVFDQNAARGLQPMPGQHGA